MNQFLDLLEGTFANKRQAQAHPTRYAHIIVNHRKISDYRFYGEQAYKYSYSRPYRQFVIDVVQEGEKFRLKNYEIENPLRFATCTNLELITDDIIKYREGCDVILSETSPGVYTGGTSTCECWVDWQGTKTYVQNEISLSKEEYQVLDRGLHAETNVKVWGSDWGPFKFIRQ